MTEPGDPQQILQAVHRALASAPAFHQLNPSTRTEITAALGKVGDYLGAGPLDPVAGGLADGRPPSTGGAAPSSGDGSVGRVGEIARATLDAIDFPKFVASLIIGTFQAIVDATIQQLEAYATLLSEVTKTVDDYMEDNVSEPAAQDYLVERYPDVFVKDTTTGFAELDVDRSDPTAQLPSFFTELGFDTVAELDPQSVETTIIPAARRSMAEQRHQTLATMVLLGLNRVVVDDGEINAKLIFSIDASELTEITFDSTETSIGTIAGVTGGAQFSGNGIMVNTTDVNAQSDINVRADLTGEVTVRFRNDYLPLANFADSAAIQLINQSATAPTLERPAENGSTSNGDESGADTAEQQSVAAPPSTPPGDADPWSPRR